MINKYSKIEINYEQLFDIKYDFKDMLLLSLIKNGVSYEFLIKLNKLSEKTIIFGSGAYDNKKIAPPVFQRFTWAEEFDCNLIFYNDPILYLGDISLGWGYGNKDGYYLKVISEIIDILINKINLYKDKVNFYGSSGGYVNYASNLIKRNNSCCK